jgi:hypothetical protein
MRTPSRLLCSLVVTIFLAAPSARAAHGVTPSDATPVQREEAQSHFARGHDLYTAKRYDDAAAEFEKSYAIVASPNALFFLARCDRERGKLVDAYAELGRTAAEAREHAADDPRYAKTAQAASDERDAIAQQLGFVTVTVTGGTPDTMVTVAGAKFPRAALGEPLPVAPGNTEIVVDTPGRPPMRQTVTVVAGEKRSVTLDGGTAEPTASTELAAPPLLSPPPDGSGAEGSGRAGIRAGAYIAAGIAVAGLATFAVLGTLSNNTYSDLETHCHGPCPATSSNEDEINRGKTEQTIANVALVAGLVGAAAAVTLFFVSSPKKPDKVTVLAGPTWVGVKGEF